VQPARPLLPHRRFLQALREALRLRPPRHQPRAL
jgi:hypothetical protein